MFTEATPELILDAYREGIFPMADTADSRHFNFYRPEKRGQLSIENLHIPRRLKKTLRQAPYEVTVDMAFAEIITGCAAEGQGRDITWINGPIRDVYIELHAMGYAHSVECWSGTGADRKLAGGLYGVAIGRVFCGESMVSWARDASKVALVHLAARLWKGGFTVLDTQFINSHLEQFGAYEISQKEYERLIAQEMEREGDFMLEKFTLKVTERDLVEDYFEKEAEHEP